MPGSHSIPTESESPCVDVGGGYKVSLLIKITIIHSMHTHKDTERVCIADLLLMLKHLL